MNDDQAREITYESPTIVPIGSLHDLTLQATIKSGAFLDGRRTALVSQ